MAAFFVFILQQNHTAPRLQPLRHDVRDAPTISNKINPAMSSRKS